jgi:hypothetical protein
MNELALNQQSQSAAAVVKIIQGPDKGEVYRILPPGVVIGRDPATCQIFVSDERVSRQQCRIDFKFNGIFLEDTSGKGTTFVNMQSITTQILSNGDQIGFGDTIIEITMEGQQALSLVGNNQALPSPFAASSPFGMNGMSASESAPQPFLNKKNILRIGFVLILGALAYVGTMKTIATKPKTIASPDDVNQAIEAVQLRQEELQAATKDLPNAEIHNRRQAEKYYIRGFRDYQNKKYSRAIESFQTTLAIYPGHIVAKRYLRLSEKRRQDLIDAHMDLGTRYKHKSMYKLCMAEFEKVLQIINQPENKKYQLAKEQIKECRLLQKGSD